MLQILIYDEKKIIKKYQTFIDLKEIKKKKIY